MRWARIPFELVLVVLTACGAGGSTPVAQPDPPSTEVLAWPQGVVTEDSATFEFTSDQSGVQFSARIDGEPWEPVESPLVLEDLTDGAHTIYIRAEKKDLVDRVPVRIQWTVDTEPPEVQVTFPPVRSLTDQGEVAVCGTAADLGGVAGVTVNGVVAQSNDGFGTWRAIVPVAGATTLVVEVTDVAGRVVLDDSRTCTPVEPPVESSEEKPRDEFELVMSGDEAIVVEQKKVTGIDLESADRRVVADNDTGDGVDFVDVVVMSDIPGRDDVVVFDTYECRLITVDTDSGDRTVIWDRLGPSDIPVNREGLIASDGECVYVQGPRLATLVALELDGSERREVAKRGWVADAVALAWDAEREQLLATDAKTGNVYAVDPADGTKTIASKHDDDYPVGRARGLVPVGDVAYAIARDHNGILKIDLETGDREFLALSGDGIDDPRAIALDADNDRLVVLDHGRTGLMTIDLEDGVCRESKTPHEAKPQCGGPIYCDAETGELCLLDAGRCSLVAIDCDTGKQRTIADLADDAPDAVDFHVDPVTGDAVVLERHGIYRIDAETGACTMVEPDPDAPMGGALVVRVEEGAETALVLETRPKFIDYEWTWVTVKSDRLMRVDLATGKCELVSERAAADFSETGQPTGGAFLDVDEGRLLLGAIECPYGSCYHGTVRAVDLETGEAESIFGVTSSTEFAIHFTGGGADPLAEVGAIVRDAARNRIYVLDREDNNVSEIDFNKLNARLEVLTGDTFAFNFPTGTSTPTSLGHGPSLKGALGMAMDPEAGLIFVTLADRVLAVDAHGGDRVVVAKLK
ncbi:MAG: hypothetical protein ACYTGZ_18880 [Planctomycetota bacterium]|jgi:DNA-binding beta-propeller fold protein YncE